jgi:hypothetical protein
MFIGRKIQVGIGKETVRGSVVAPTYWMPKLEASVEEKRVYANDESSIGNIADAVNSKVVKEFAEGEIQGNITDKTFGLILLAGLGQVSSVAGTAGDTAVYTHTFSVKNDNAHPSLSIEVKDDVAQYAFPLAMLNSLKINAEVGKYATFSAGFKAKKGATSSSTPAYTEENTFISKHASLKLATNLAGLTAAPVLDVKSVEISIDKNLDEEEILGSLEPKDITNQQISVSGNIEAAFKDETTFKNLFKAGTKKAVRIALTNSDVTIGATKNPTIQIDLASCVFEDWSRPTANNASVTQTIKFKGLFSIADAKMIEIALTSLAVSF